MHAEQRELERLLAEHGELMRTTKHKVYLLDNGQMFTVPKSPSDDRWAHNALETLRQVLGIKRVVRKNPARRRKNPPPAALHRFDPPAHRVDWKDHLRRIKL